MPFKNKTDKIKCNKRWYRRNRKKVLNRVKNRRINNLSKVKAGEKRYAFKLKSIVFNWYGGKCVCCGEGHTQILTLDHALDNGNIHRKTQPGGKILYRAIFKSGKIDKELQILCPNCNMGKRFGNGFCFHHPKKDLRVIR